jgi:very-short-patch-repair endonuclease
MARMTRQNRTLKPEPTCIPASAAQALRARQTPAEELLWAHLRGNAMSGLKFRRQHRITGTDYVVDFCCPAEKLIIELDGPVHEQQQQQDQERQEQLEALGYRVLRFANEQVEQDLPGVLDSIRAKVKG